MRNSKSGLSFIIRAHQNNQLCCICANRHNYNTLATVTGSIHRRQRDTWPHHRKTSAWPVFIINQLTDNFMIARWVKPSESEALSVVDLWSVSDYSHMCVNTEHTVSSSAVWRKAPGKSTVPSAGAHSSQLYFAPCYRGWTSGRNTTVWLYLHIWLLVSPSYKINLLCEENTKGNTG